MSIYTTNYHQPYARADMVILECRGGKQPCSGYLFARHEIDVLNLKLGKDGAAAGEQFRLDCIYP